jgi:hypothetical protein
VPLPAALLLVGALFVTASIAAFATASLLAGYAALRFIAILNRADTLPEALQDRHCPSRRFVASVLTRDLFPVLSKRNTRLPPFSPGPLSSSRRTT